MRHKTSKRIFRILTHTGVIDATEDHSLCDINGNKIKPSECHIGMELLNSFPEFNEFNNKSNNEFDNESNNEFDDDN